MKKPFVLHPFLFAVFPILFLYAYNIDAVPLNQIFIPLIVVLLFTLLMFSLLSVISKNKVKTGLIISLFSVLFFSYGHFCQIVGTFRFAVKGFIIGQHKIFFPLITLLFFLVGYVIIKTPKKLYNLTAILNITSFSLVIISIFNIGSYEFRTRYMNRYNEGYVKDKADNAVDSQQPDILRDIYYIILDGYAGEGVLKEIYDYDNQDVRDYLTNKGFYVTSKSRTNYVRTDLSLASSLNMEYLVYLAETAGEKSPNEGMTQQMIKNSKVMNFLKSRGYKFIHFISGWEVTNFNEYADMNIDTGTIGEFHRVLIETTMLKAFHDKFANFNDYARKQILLTFSKLAQVYKIEGPKFIFAHIVSPHPPYLFEADGSPTSGIERGWHQLNPYLNQLIFVNKKLEELIDEILSKSEIPPIIVIQADHGPAFIFDTPGSDGYPNDKQIRVWTHIFNTYYMPSGGISVLYDSITPVNSFRAILDYYFGATYGLLSDKTYFSDSFYQLVDVTDRGRY